MGGVIAIADPIKPTTAAALETLRADGIHIVMLTGDNRATAEAVARTLGIDDIEAGLYTLKAQIVAAIIAVSPERADNLVPPAAEAS